MKRREGLGTGRRSLAVPITSAANSTGTKCIYCGIKCSWGQARHHEEQLCGQEGTRRQQRPGELRAELLPHTQPGPPPVVLLQDGQPQTWAVPCPSGMIPEQPQTQDIYLLPIRNDLGEIPNLVHACAHQNLPGVSSRDTPALRGSRRNPQSSSEPSEQFRAPRPHPRLNSPLSHPQAHFPGISFELPLPLSPS